MHARIVLPLAFALWAGSSVVVLAQVGTNPVTFATSCAAGVQGEFERGVALVHTYSFAAAERQFQSVLEKDPKCAMAHWGIALALAGDPLGGPPPVKDAQAAWTALDKARALAPPTPRERDWLDALATYFRDHETVPNESRLDAWDAALEKLTQKYPDDAEAKVFRALALLATVAKNDMKYIRQEKSAAMLEKLYEQNPRHPGVTHYLILAYDAPPLAEKGTEAAQRYARIAPDAPDARHAPSHIYAALGMWEASITANAAALEIQPDFVHAADSLLYAALQRGLDGKARALLDTQSGAAPRARPPTADSAIALAAMPARYAMERLDWRGAAELPLTPGPFPQAESITRFARGLGMALSANVAGAKREIEAMNGLRTALQKADQGYWADRTEEQALAVSAWVALAEGRRPEALKLMRAAADSEDAHIKRPPLDNRLVPLRELLGQMLMEITQPVAALQEFEAALDSYPDRYRALWGAVLCAAASGQKQKAFEYIDKFVALTKDADAQRSEAARARAFVSKR